MSFPKAELHKKPTNTAEGYSYGGGYILLCPTVQRMTKGENGLVQINSNFPSLVLDLGENVDDTAQMICDAINEKLERDFTNGSN